jgi:hypothetical protein
MMTVYFASWLLLKERQVGRLFLPLESSFNLAERQPCTAE